MLLAASPLKKIKKLKKTGNSIISMNAGAIAVCKSRRDTLYKIYAFAVYHTARTIAWGRSEIRVAP